LFNKYYIKAQKDSIDPILIFIRSNLQFWYSSDPISNFNIHPIQSPILIFIRSDLQFRHSSDPISNFDIHSIRSPILIFIRSNIQFWYSSDPISNFDKSTEIFLQKFFTKNFKAEKSGKKFSKLKKILQKPKVKEKFVAIKNFNTVHKPAKNEKWPIFSQISVHDDHVNDPITVRSWTSDDHFTRLHNKQRLTAANRTLNGRLANRTRWLFFQPPLNAFYMIQMPAWAFGHRFILKECVQADRAFGKSGFDRKTFRKSPLPESAS